MSAIHTQAIYPIREDIIRKQLRARRLAVFLIIILGGGLEACYLALYPWLAGQAFKDPLRQSWEAFLPWLVVAYKQLDWRPYVMTFAWPPILHGYLFPLLILLIITLFCIWLTVIVSNRAGRIIVIRSALYLRPVFVIILLLSSVFALTMVLSPVHLNEMSRTMLASDLYGRMVESYHLNPYLPHAAAIAHDPVQIILAQLNPKQSSSTSLIGPLWMDISILISLVSHSDLARMVLGWRVLALCAHLLNIILLWALLSAQKPLYRIASTVLYAWNPLVLLLGVSLVHPEILLLSFILLSLLSLQRDATVLGWVFAMLAALISPVCLILLPLLLLYAFRRACLQGCGLLFLWSIGMVLVTALIVFLAYIPYWQGWGMTGILTSLRTVFWQNTSVNSLDAAVLGLPIHFPARISWFFQAHIWSAAALTIILCYLFVALWLANSFEMLLQCSSWVLLLWVVLQPEYWPWYLIVPFVLALSSSNRRHGLSAIFLLLGALLCYYFWQWADVWPGQGLVVIGVPLLLWGWAMFFYSSWQMVLNRGDQATINQDSQPMEFIDPPWSSHPSWYPRATRSRSRMYR
jgi:hypothetical protein